MRSDRAPGWPRGSRIIEEDFSLRIGREREDVFRVLTGFERYLAQWAKGPVAAHKVTEGDGVGTRFAIVARVGLFRVSSPYIVKAWEPPGKFAGSGVAGPVTFDEEYVLEAAGSATELRQSIVARPRGPFRLVAGLIRRKLKRLIRADLERLRQLVEAER